MSQQIDQVVEKLGNLSAARLAEVEDFIDFLRQRDLDARQRLEFARASESSFAKVWENEDDAIYDSL